MSGAITIDEITPSSVTLGSDERTQITLDGGASSVTVEESGTNVFGGGSGPAGFSWTSPSAQSSWVIPHNLGRFPIVGIRDSQGEKIEADVEHLDVNTLLVTFNQPVLGSVDLA